MRAALQSSADTGSSFRRHSCRKQWDLQEIVLRSSQLKMSANAIGANPLIVVNNVCLPRWSADPSLSLLGQGPV